MDNESTYICMELELFLWNKKLQTILFQDINHRHHKYVEFSPLSKIIAELFISSSLWACGSSPW